VGAVLRARLHFPLRAVTHTARVMGVVVCDVIGSPSTLLELLESGVAMETRRLLFCFLTHKNVPSRRGVD
jgi:hypothetical protein